MTKTATTSPAPAVGRGGVEVEYKGQRVTLAFGLYLLRAYGEKMGYTGPSFVKDMLEAATDKLICGLCFCALNRALRGTDAAPLDEEEVACWLDLLDKESGDQIGAAIAHAITVQNPTVGAFQATMAAKVAPPEEPKTGTKSKEPGSKS